MLQLTNPKTVEKSSVDKVVDFKEVYNLIKVQYLLNMYFDLCVEYHASFINLTNSTCGK